MEMNKKTDVVHIVWFLLIFLLPITSLPLASRILGSTMVAAPSILLLGILVILLFLFHSQIVLKISPIMYPILLFVLMAIISSLLSFWLPTPIQKEYSILRNVIEGLGTLMIGVTFYFITVNIIQSELDLKNTLRMISFSFIPLSIWCFLQFFYGQILGDYPEWMRTIQVNISTSGILYRDRLTGFAFEPSWLAHQLNMFYIPIFLSSAIKRKSVFTFSYKKLLIEDIFLLFSIFFLIFSKSRVGWITFFVVVTYLFITLNQHLIKIIRRKYFHENKNLFSKFLPITLFIFYILIFVFGLFFFSKFDPRMETLFQLETYRNRNLFSIANEFVFAERILYWQTGWKVFNDHPIFGVGLSNIGFYFKDYLPPFAWALDEPRHLLFQASYQGNVKNLWIRLLSETGIVGFLSFITWLLLFFFRAKQFNRSPSPTHQLWGLIGKIALITLLVEGFSIDSFALPYYWIIFGLISSNYLGKIAQPKNDIIR